MAVTDYVVVALVAGSVAFALVAALGIVRLPDVYARIHAVSKSETLGAVLALAAVAITVQTNLGTVKAIALLAFLFLTNPTAAHAVARAAEDQGIEPWTAGSEEPTATDSGGERG